MSATGQFIKFNRRELTRELPADTAPLTEACNALSARGLLAPYEDTDCIGSNGNISQRCDHGGFIITATQLASKWGLAPTDFVRIESCADNEIKYHGEKPPSSESLLHWYLYEHFPETTAIAHVHEANDLLYPERPRWAELGVVETDRDVGGGTLEVGEITAAAFTDASTYVILKNHRPDWDPNRTGTVALGRTLTEAVDRALNIHKALKP
jgi:ribulose-5-phosphate 4-epimerase/fuculose-1-phosphate aldolase